MIQAASTLVAISVDCTKPGQNQELQTRYGVRGYPTVIFLNPQGEKVAELRSRDPAAVKAQIEEIVRAHSRPVVADMPLADGLALAREQRKLLVVVFGERETPDLAPLLELVLSPPMAETRGRFLWIRRPFAGERGRPTDEAKEHGARKAPTVLVLDPWAEGRAQTLKTLTTFRALKRDLEKCLEDATKAGHPPAADATPPADGATPPATPPADGATPPATPPGH